MTEFRLSARRVTAADPAEAWSVISDLDGYHRYAANLVSTTVTAGQGLGARRTCVDTSGSAWDETCTAWEPERRVEVTVDVATYPMKLKAFITSLTGTWEVQTHPGGAQIAITFTGVMRRFPASRRLARSLERRNAASVESILDRYSEALASNAAGSGTG